MSGLCLVINLGSSSVKAALYEPRGGDQLHCLWKQGLPLDGQSHQHLGEWLHDWLSPALAEDLPKIQRIGHRVVHGGDQFTAPTLITPAVEQALAALSPLAPLHNPPALNGIAWARHWAPHAQQWACFDTAFHHTLPEAARTYALPQAIRDQGFRRYGFHGLNHQHVSETVLHHWQSQGRNPNQLRLISAHLGAGASLAAIQGGHCIDTTMGYTPLEGLVMSTRSGSVDPGVLLELMRRGMNHAALTQALEQNSGVKGLSGLSGDMREIREKAQAGDQPAQLALTVFRHRLLQLIGSMAASLKGVDVLTLTGGVGEHDKALRSELSKDLSWIPQLELMVIPADEEGMIAQLIKP